MTVIDRQQIIEKVRLAGIVGAGGAGFPTHVKLSSSAEVVIGNGAECEPLLESDRHLMLREPEKVIRGLRLAVTAVGASRGILAIKAKHTDVIASLRPLLETQPDLELFLLEDFYPTGDEHVLVYEVAGRVVPMGGIPPAVGVVVENVFTLAAVTDAMADIPFTHRYITVAGAVRRPAVALLPIGLSLNDAIEMVGLGLSEDNCRVIVGGPMMGKVEDDLQQSLIKTTSAILVLPADCRTVELKTQDLSVAVKRSRSVCCQCRFCTDMCPRFLLGHDLNPHKGMRVFANADGHFEESAVLTATLCSECGLCGYYACSMGLQPNIIHAHFKRALAENKIKPGYSDRPVPTASPFRDGIKVPVKRLINRMGLSRYDRHLPFETIAGRPHRLVLPLQQHIGTPATPTVRPGDSVSIGTVLASMPQGTLGAELHSPMAGIVMHVSDKIVIESLEKTRASVKEGRISQ